MGLFHTACAAFSDVTFGVIFMLHPAELCLLFPICEQLRNDKCGHFCSVQVFYACTFVINWRCVKLEYVMLSLI